MFVQRRGENLSSFFKVKPKQKRGRKGVRASGRSISLLAKQRKQELGMGVR